MRTHTLCWFTVCMAKAACLVALLQVLKLQRLALLLISDIKISQNIFIEYALEKWS